MFEVTNAWKSAFPDAHVGVVVLRNVTNPAQHPELEQRKAELEEQLRAQFSGQDRLALSTHPILRAYNNYYRRFMKNLLLTAGHDLDTLELPLVLDISKGDERYTLMRGEEQALKAGDMFISDQNGVISSIIYGPDRRTQIKAETRNVVFTVYAPDGISEPIVQKHLEDIRDYIRMFAPQAQVESLQVLGSL
jgi:DNA/RNA-binding domain of Phe-tRNA-synthetase-like protein